MTSASDRAWDKAMQSGTLTEAHNVLVELRPSRSASSAVWRQFHTRSAAVYVEVAEIDRGHHHEALYWAGLCRRRVDALESGQAEPRHGLAGGEGL
jgi:hypothetical protein